MSRTSLTAPALAVALTWVALPAWGQSITVDTATAAEFVDADDPRFRADPNGTSRFSQAYRTFGFNGPEFDANDSSYYLDPDGASRVHLLRRSFGYGQPEVDADDPSYWVDPSGTTRLNSLEAGEVLSGPHVWDGDGLSNLAYASGAFGGNRCRWTLYGACVQMFANLNNAVGGGIAISDDGGFGDWNDGWIRFFGSNGVDMRGRTIRTGGGAICLRAPDGSDDCRTQWPVARNSSLHQRDKSCGTGGGGHLTANGDECCEYDTNCHSICTGWWGRGGSCDTFCDRRRECNSFRGWTNN